MNLNILIRHAERSDFEQWWRMRVVLWPYATLPEDEQEMRDFLRSDTQAAFVAQSSDGRLVGFLEAGIRDYADGCVTPNVGYVEGWYVEEEFRRQGVGGALINAAEAWARSHGCQEMASDCLLDNTVSLTAHLALEYKEAERLIHFVKPL